MASVAGEREERTTSSRCQGGRLARCSKTVYAFTMDIVESQSPGPAGGAPARVVLKFGSRLLTGGTTTLDPDRMRMVARVVAAAEETQVVVVSSGAVAAGFRILGYEAPPSRIRDRQAAAAVGQTRLMAMWSDAFRAVDLDVAQVLLTNDCLTDRRRYVAARRALATLLDAGVVPIVNENDTVSVEEIVVGDNDNLAASAAALVDADVLALLTDVPGVYDADPSESPHAKIIPEASSADELRVFCFSKKAPESRGGMETKLEAAERAGRYGIPTLIASGTDPDALTTIVNGGSVGTFIAASDRPLAARRHWMAVQKGLGGAIVADEGAVEALRRKANLLPSGILGVRGHFRRGDLVAVVDADGVEHARGIVSLDDRDVDKIKGLHTREAKKALGRSRSQVVMRTERMVLVGEEGRA
jgi:glutamate 5-kinase